MVEYHIIKEVELPTLEAVPNEMGELCLAFILHFYCPRDPLKVLIKIGPESQEVLDQAKSVHDIDPKTYPYQPKQEVDIVWGKIIVR